MLSVAGMDTEANKTGVTVAGTKLSSGDGAFVTAKDSSKAMTVSFSGSNQDSNVRAEVLVFDLAKTK